jgi:hypothetical protein
MQCVSCRFENMPGVSACGRCGSPLGLQTLAVDMQPPRAGAWSKRLRRWTPFRSVYYGARDAGRATARTAWFQDVLQGTALGTPMGVLGRLIFPGWAHLYLGQQALGRMFLGSWLVLLLLVFLLYGSTPGSIFLGLVFSVHIASCASVLRLGSIRAWAFWCCVVLASALLLVGVYLPVGWLVSRVVTPVQVQIDTAPFEAGDVVLCSPLLQRFRVPRTGDVVLYNHRTGIRLPLPPPQHGYLVVPPGQRIDRILAEAGDRVYWKDGRLTVNDQPSPLQPLNPEARPPNLTLTVPAGRYLIMPTVGLTRPDGLPEQQWRDLCLVPAGDIEGRVLLRSHPLTRVRRFP